MYVTSYYVNFSNNKIYTIGKIYKAGRLISLLKRWQSWWAYTGYKYRECYAAWRKEKLGLL